MYSLTNLTYKLCENNEYELHWMSQKCFQIATTANCVSFVQKIAELASALYSAWHMQAAKVECMSVRAIAKIESCTRKNDVKYLSFKS